MPSFRATFVASGLALSFGIPVCAEEAAAPPASSAVRSQAPVLPVIPPRLSLPTLQYYNAHPDEYRQFLARLPQRRVAPSPPVPAGAAWQPATRDRAGRRAQQPAAAHRRHGHRAPGLHRGLVQADPGHQRQLRQRHLVQDRLDAGRLRAALLRLPGPQRRARHRQRRRVQPGLLRRRPGVWTNRGAVYNPATDSWASVSPPSGWANIGDAQSVVLPNGKYMLANALTKQQALLNPSTMTWTPTGTGKFDVNDEEGWTLLQDGTVSSRRTATSSPAPAAGTRSATTRPPVPGRAPATARCSCRTAAASMPSYEVGPQVLRADGSVVSFSGVANGAVAGTSIFRPASRTWSVGPNLPRINGRELRPRRRSGGLAQERPDPVRRQPRPVPDADALLPVHAR